MNGPWRNGNSVSLLENGEEFFPRVLELIAAARNSVYVETFILADDVVGQGLRDALVAAAKRGVAVDLLVDGFGSDGLSPEFRAALAESGVRLHIFEPRKRVFGVRTNLLRRMHRKITLIDARIALIGGINYCAEQLIETGPEALQDFAVEIEGPVVADVVQFVQASSSAPRLPWFLRWHRRRARAQANQHETRGSARMRFVTRDNQRHRTTIEREYRRAIAMAHTEILVANAYFFPGYRLLRALRDAAKRGVKVTLMVQGRPDMRIVSIVARWLYGYLIPAGVRVLEYCDRPMHAKVALVDERWCTVGSSNLDPLSLSLNLEANVFIDDRQFRDQLRERLQCMIDKGCRVVPADSVPPRTFWQTLSTGAVFHFLRHFPRWFDGIPAHRQRIEAATPLIDAPIEAAAPKVDASIGDVGRSDDSDDDAASAASMSLPVPAWQRMVGVALVALVAVLLWRAAGQVDWPAVGAALSQRSRAELLFAGALALGGHALYGALDVLARGYARHTLAGLRCWLIATVCYVLSLNLGVVLGGMAMRLRLYGRQGVGAGAAARAALATMAGNWTGHLALLAVVPWLVSEQTLSQWGVGIGAAPLSAIAVLLLLIYFVQSARERSWRWRGVVVRVPPLRLALQQGVLGAGSWAVMATVLWLCLGREIAWVDVLATLLCTAIAGMIVRVPGGWGVLEFVVVGMLSSQLPAAELVAGVLAYRALYYLLPLIPAAPAYFWLEHGPRPAATQAQAALKPARPAGWPASRQVAQQGAGR